MTNAEEYTIAENPNKNTPAGGKKSDKAKHG